MKRFFSCIDANLPAPQPIQHLAIRVKAEKSGGAVSFYGAEDVRSLAAQSLIRVKLQRLKQRQEVDGVIFYTVEQFCYGDVCNFQLLRQILEMNLEIHFACEGLSLIAKRELDDLFPFLFAVDYIERRDASAEWKKFVAAQNIE